MVSVNGATMTGAGHQMEETKAGSSVQLSMGSLAHESAITLSLSFEPHNPSRSEARSQRWNQAACRGTTILLLASHYQSLNMVSVHRPQHGFLLGTTTTSVSNIISAPRVEASRS